MKQVINIFDDDAELIFNGHIFEELEESIHSPLDIRFDATKTTTNYSDVDVDTKSPLFSETLQKLNLEDNDLHGFDRSKLPSAETGTKKIWGRESVLKKIIFVNMLLKNTRKKNDKIVTEYGYAKNPER